ncbi:MAG: hypothetical protein JKX75_09930, partial [Gammaproteobacteria bacterium]|nr:hypothetical protein [Gammaproteobacteria bacterium]
MLKLPNKFKIMLFSMVYGMLVAVPAVAEDIEIYTTAGTTAASTTSQPNVLLILDTSGSMGSSVLTRPPFDSSVDYSSGGGCFKDDRAYILPYGGFYAWIHCNGFYSQFYGTPDQLSQVELSEFVCDAANDIETVGYATERFSQYRSGAWSNSITSDDEDDFVECESDQGVHGETSSSSLTWASQSGSAWSSSQSDEIDWASRGFGATLHTGRYANYLITAPVTNAGTRISVMQQAIKDLIDSLSGINVGLMRFDSSSNGGMIATPVESVDNAAHAQELKDDVDAMTASGGTPLSESFYEAALYFQGRAVDYGNGSSPFNSVSDSKTGSSYKSPIVDECQKNYAIILTDGDPTGDSLNSTRRANLNSTTSAIGNCTGNCLDEIAKSIGTNDQSTSVTGDQFVSTFTIGFAIDNQLLLDTANESFLATGSGKRYLAEDAASLTDVLNEVFASVYEVDTSFSSPAVSVNAFNRATHLDDLFFTLFQPKLSPHWDGNLKKYKLAFIADPNDATQVVPRIVDSLGVVAVDSNTGFFTDTARSFWTDGADDGNDVTAGGAANEFALGRNVYTYTSSYTSTNGVLTPLSASVGNLTASVNRVTKTNTAITEGMLGVAAGVEFSAGFPLRDAVIDWAEGIDVKDFDGDSNTAEARRDMGDPLHSEPALVIYGGTEASPDLVAYMATNDGYLHAIDVTDGSEIFSFIPQELLPNLDTVMNDTTGSKTYGLDGNVVAWVNDVNEDGIISGAGEHVYLYIGMRRGGKDIYSVDVTDRNTPKLRWIIKGGTGDYAALAQTWSSINVEKIKDGSVEKTVLIFGGGYDTNQDNVTVRTPDSIGNAVFIADAESGQLLWSAGPGGTTVLSDMDYSVPARVKPLDLTGDGLTDRMYVVDMGGQMFRFDIDNDNNGALASSVTGGRVADLASTGSANARRFYYPPDVALIAERGKAAYLAIGIASGYRAHPLNTTIEDRIYLLKDNDVYTPPSGGYTTLTESDLFDATLNLVAGDGNSTQNAAALSGLDSSDGWFIKLDDETVAANYVGEKGLSEALFIEGTLIVTTYIPDDPSLASSNCSKDSSGSGKVFFLDVLDASAAYPSSGDVQPDRHVALSKEGIPPSPNVIITKGGEPTLCIGTECQSAN